MYKVLDSEVKTIARASNGSDPDIIKLVQAGIIPEPEPKQKHRGRWFRFYDDTVNDPKVQRLPPHLFKTWINYLCLASKNDGKLPPVEDIAYTTRRTPDDVLRDISALAARHLLDDVGGDWVPHNWETRQYKSDLSTQRVREHRKRSKAVA